MADAYEISFARRMTEVARDEWEALAARYDTPLLSWGFLALLEESGSIRAENGWEPAHLLVRRGPSAGGEPGRGRLVAAAPFYVKSHSWGEFVFDFQFAEIAQRAKIRYYPKLVGMVPATPAPAWRIMTAPGEDEEALVRLALDAVLEAAGGSGLGGVHILWPDHDFAQRVERHSNLAAGGETRGWAAWGHQAFLWRDDGYGDFEGFLASFSKNMRRNVRRERESMRSAGHGSRMIGPEEARAKPALLGRMAELYDAHNEKFGPWAARFLTRDFFLRLPEFMPTGWAMAAGFEEGRHGTGAAAEAVPTGLAFLLEGAHRLYGRYWGAAREIPGLHFELCYYLPIEYALAKGIGSFDPGMGSPHKARRGFRSSIAPSYHYVYDARLASLMSRLMPQLGAEAEAEAAALDEDLPFKKVGGRP